VAFLPGEFRTQRVHHVGVTIDVISSPDPKLWPRFQDLFPEFDGIILMIAGPKRNGGQGFLSLKGTYGHETKAQQGHYAKSGRAH
jgi:hypothetical protein